MMTPRLCAASFALAALSPRTATDMKKIEPAKISKMALASVMQSAYPIYADKTITPNRR